MEVRSVYHDITFIETFLTQEFCDKHKLFTDKFNRETGMYEIVDRDYRKIKAKLLFSLTNFGQPLVTVIDGNYRNRGELLLKHQYEGIGLKPDYTRDTLKNLQSIWRRPVFIETVANDEPVRIGFDGKEILEEKITADQEDAAAEVEA